MKSLIIYVSDYKKNTEKIAEIFAEKLNAELVNIKDVNNIDITNYNLIGFGSGVYNESISPKLYKFADKFNLQDKDVFVFSTSGAGMKYYNNSLIKNLISKGAINKGSFACKGSFIASDFTDNKIFKFASRFSKGHPNEKDYREAVKFIEKIMD